MISIGSINKYKALYLTVNALMVRLGSDGEYHPDLKEVNNVMNALHDIDGGTGESWTSNK